MPCAAIIVASGSSRRMGFDKLAAPLMGRPVLRMTVEAFMAAESVSRVIVVCPEERLDSLLAGDFPKPLTRVEGGAERCESVMSGLEALRPGDELVAVHDGARPLVTSSAINLCVTEAEKHGAATLARPITETIKRADEKGFSDGGVDREGLWHTETPQIFRTELLLKAYDVVAARGVPVTDEVSAMELIGIPTKLVSSAGPNLKITHSGDIELATALCAG